jgi:hypothetical protein
VGRSTQGRPGDEAHHPYNEQDHGDDFEHFVESPPACYAPSVRSRT